MQADAAQELRSALLDHELYLGNFDAAREVVWHWDGSAFVPGAVPEMQALRAWQVKDVSVSHDVVTVEADTRSLLQSGAAFTLAPQTVPVRLVITVPHRDQDQALQRLAAAIFFPDRQTALAAIPAKYSALLPTTPDGLPPVRGLKCDCADLGQPACLGKNAVLGLTHPHLLRQASPEFTQEARRKKFSGNVRIVMTVDSTGHTGDLWVAHSIGMGLDEAAAKAARQYVFQPAVCHGQPAPMPLAVDVNFQIF